MRLAFMGSPDFSVPTLRALRDAGHEIAAIYCQPPRRAGRGHAVRPCPMHAAALEMGLPVRTPARLRRDPQAQADFAALNLDIAIVAAYGLILPQAMLDAPHRGCLNIHASLLPRWRGAAPIQAAILAGDTKTGITIMQMDAGLDTGPMRLREAVPITATTTASDLHDTLAILGARLILRALTDDTPAIPQPPEGASYAPKLERTDGKLDFFQPAIALDRRVRALNPWPGTFCQFGDIILKILTAELAPGAGQPGTILDDALTVACGEGALRLTRVQLPGRAAQPADSFLRGHTPPPGKVLT